MNGPVLVDLMNHQLSENMGLDLYLPTLHTVEQAQFVECLSEVKTQILD